MPDKDGQMSEEETMHDIARGNQGAQPPLPKDHKPKHDSKLSDRPLGGPNSGDGASQGDAGNGDAGDGA